MGTFKVLDMNCGHCEKTILKEFARLHSEVKVEIDLKQKEVRVENLGDEKVISLLKEIGFTPEKMK